MALQASTESPAEIATFLEAHAKPTFLVVYASIRPSDGQSWCGDCRRAEPLVTRKLGAKAEAGSVKVVYAGSEAECVVPTTVSLFPKYDRVSLRWRDASNPWRKSPFLITKLPTIVRVTEGTEEGHCCVDGQCGIDEEADDTVWSRLVEGDCYNEEKLDKFVGK